MADGAEQVTRVLIAATKEGQMQHVGILTAEQLGEAKTAALKNARLPDKKERTDKIEKDQ